MALEAEEDPDEKRWAPPGIRGSLDELPLEAALVLLPARRRRPALRRASACRRASALRLAWARRLLVDRWLAVAFLPVFRA